MRIPPAAYQFIHEQALRPGRVGMLFKKVRRRVLRSSDPVVHWELEGRRLSINLSHQLPFYRQNLPGYSANLTRLAEYVRHTCGALRMIDVGANIGDSYCLARPRPNDEFLLVEGDEAYFRLLTQNTSTDPAVTRVRALLAEKSSAAAGRIVVQAGTGRVDHSASLMTNHRTLDDVVAQHRQFRSANFLKTDVDGYDSRVLMGAQDLLASAQPVVFFEHHPELLARAGDDDAYIFRELVRFGYREFLFYDNRGQTLTIVNAEDTAQIDGLLDRARSTRHYYYDVGAFPDGEKLAQDEFVARERHLLANH